MAKKVIHLVLPQQDITPDDGKPVTPMFIRPEGATPGREVPGFFIIQIDGDPIKSSTKPSNPDFPWLPKQFLSLDAVHDWLRETYGWKTPLHVTSFMKVDGTRDFPVIWGADRRIGRKKVQVRVRYLGSFAYWDGRRVDPTKVGTRMEFN
jgi:hypothetical protein